MGVREAHENGGRNGVVVWWEKAPRGWWIADKMAWSLELMAVLVVLVSRSGVSDVMGAGDRLKGVGRVCQRFFSSFHLFLVRRVGPPGLLGCWAFRHGRKDRERASVESRPSYFLTGMNP